VRRVGLALLAVVALVAACGGGDDENGAAGQGELRDVSSVGVVANDFDADAGTPRVVLLLSPT
jgi:hypothetical protein